MTTSITISDFYDLLSSDISLLIAYFIRDSKEYLSWLVINSRRPDKMYKEGIKRLEPLKMKQFLRRWRICYERLDKGNLICQMSKATKNWSKTGRITVLNQLGNASDESLIPECLKFLIPCTIAEIRGQETYFQAISNKQREWNSKCAKFTAIVLFLIRYYALPNGVMHGKFSIFLTQPGMLLHMGVFRSVRIEGEAIFGKVEGSVIIIRDQRLDTILECKGGEVAGYLNFFSDDDENDPYHQRIQWSGVRIEGPQQRYESCSLGKQYGNWMRDE